MNIDQLFVRSLTLLQTPLSRLFWPRYRMFRAQVTSAPGFCAVNYVNHFTFSDNQHVPVWEASSFYKRREIALQFMENVIRNWRSTNCARFVLADIVGKEKGMHHRISPYLPEEFTIGCAAWTRTFRVTHGPTYKNPNSRNNVKEVYIDRADVIPK
jgi:hypothetical protein